MRSMSTKQRKSRRARILCGRQYVECHYCGSRLTMHEMTLDHVKAQAKGGTNAISNFVPSCRACNRMKGDMGYQEFLSKCREIAGSAA